MSDVYFLASRCFPVNGSSTHNVAALDTSVIDKYIIIIFVERRLQDTIGKIIKLGWLVNLLASWFKRTFESSPWGSMICCFSVDSAGLISNLFNCRLIISMITIERKLYSYFFLGALLGRCRLVTLTVIRTGLPALVLVVLQTKGSLFMHLLPIRRAKHGLELKLQHNLLVASFIKKLEKI